MTKLSFLVSHFLAQYCILSELCPGRVPAFLQLCVCPIIINFTSSRYIWRMATDICDSYFQFSSSDMIWICRSIHYSAIWANDDNENWKIIPSLWKTYYKFHIQDLKMLPFTHFSRVNSSCVNNFPNIMSGWPSALLQTPNHQNSIFKTDDQHVCISW